MCHPMILSSMMAFAMIQQVNSELTLLDETYPIKTRPASSQSQDPPDSIWRSHRMCGVNSLYILLCSTGPTCNYSDLLKNINVGPKGTNLAELRDAANKLGRSILVVRETPDTLLNNPLPIVAHLDDGREDTGHFCVVIAQQDDSFHIVDGSTATFHKISKDRFYREWTGYLLINKSSPLDNPAFFPLVFVAIPILFVFTLTLRNHFKKSRQLVVAILAAQAFLPPPSNALAGIPDSLKNTLNDYGRHFSQIQIEWREIPKSTMPLEDLLKETASNNRQILSGRTNRYSRSGEKTYFWSSPLGTTSFFDLSIVGDTYKTRTDKAGTGFVTSLSDLQQRMSKKSGPIFGPLQFSGWGYYLPCRASDVREPVRSLLLEMIDRPETEIITYSEKTIDNVKCPSIHIKTPDEEYLFTLDPRLNYSSIEVEKRQNEQTQWRSKNHDYQLLSSGFWFPRKSSFEWYKLGKAQSQDKPLMTIECTVAKLSIAPIPEDTFALPFAAGTNVFDATIPEAKNTYDGAAYYRMPANQTDLQTAIQEGQIAKEAMHRKRAFPTIFVVANIVLLGGGIITLTWWRLRYRRNTGK